MLYPLMNFKPVSLFVARSFISSCPWNMMVLERGAARGSNGITGAPPPSSPPEPGPLPLLEEDGEEDRDDPEVDKVELLPSLPGGPGARGAALPGNIT